MGRPASPARRSRARPVRRVPRVRRARTRLRGKDEANGKDGADGHDGQTCPAAGYTWDLDALVCRRDGTPQPNPSSTLLGLPAERFHMSMALSAIAQMLHRHGFSHQPESLGRQALDDRGDGSRVSVVAAERLGPGSFELDRPVVGTDDYGTGASRCSSLMRHRRAVQEARTHAPVTPGSPNKTPSRRPRRFYAFARSARTSAAEAGPAFRARNSAGAGPAAREPNAALGSSV